MNTDIVHGTLSVTILCYNAIVIWIIFYLESTKLLQDQGLLYQASSLAYM